MGKNLLKQKNLVSYVKNMLKSHKKSVMILVVCILLSVGTMLRDRADIGESGGIVERGTESGSTRSEIFSFRLQESEEMNPGNGDGQEQTGEEKMELELEVSAVQQSREDALELLEQAVSEWEDSYLGDNSSANEVRYDLNLVSELCDGQVQVSYESSDSTALQTDGTVTAETAASGSEGGEATLVELTVEFTCGDYARIETYTLRILPPEEGSEAWILSELQRAAEEAEENSREQLQFSLPDTVAGYRVIWTEEPEYRWLVFLLVGVAAVFCLEQKGRQDEKERQRKRKERLLFEYPQMVDQFAVLLDSGMTIRRAWERIVNRNYSAQGKRGKSKDNVGVYLEEMRITYREIREGRGERDAYERFGRRIGLAPYKRFSSILTQNLSKGTKDIRDILQNESEAALDMRRKRARKLGEEAGTRLLFPMLVMLVLILAVLLLPALESF